MHDGRTICPYDVPAMRPAGKAGQSKRKEKKESAQRKKRKEKYSLLAVGAVPT